MASLYDNVSVPFVCLYEQLDRPLSSLIVQDMKSVAHEDTDLNSDYSVDPLADPRLDKMDLFNMVDSQDRDKIMNSTVSFDAGEADMSIDIPPVDSSSESGSGE